MTDTPGVKTPAYIMAVPWDVARVKRAMAIREEVGNATIVWDQTHNAMDTFRLLLQRVVDDGNQAFFIFEDDVELTSNWREKAQAVVAQRPHQIVQFFSMEKDGQVSRERDGATFISNLCVYIPEGYASELLAYSYAFVEKYPQFSTGNDFVIRYWLRNRREAYYLYYPNLVQHEGWVSSINAKRPRWRKSHNYES